jgi:hypothetical protein
MKREISNADPSLVPQDLSKQIHRLAVIRQKVIRIREILKQTLAAQQTRTRGEA